MRKKLFLCMTAVILMAAGAFVFTTASSNSTTAIFDIALENVSALAQNGEGTSVSTCYIKDSFSSTRTENTYECDDDTDSETIYPCPSSTSDVYHSKPSTNCTK